MFKHKIKSTERKWVSKLKAVKKRKWTMIITDHCTLKSISKDFSYVLENKEKSILNIKQNTWIIKAVNFKSSDVDIIIWQVGRLENFSQVEKDFKGTLNEWDIWTYSNTLKNKSISFQKSGFSYSIIIKVVKNINVCLNVFQITKIIMTRNITSWSVF